MRISLEQVTVLLWLVPARFGFAVFESLGVQLREQVFSKSILNSTLRLISCPPSQPQSKANPRTQPCDVLMGGVLHKPRDRHRSSYQSSPHMYGKQTTSTRDITGTQYSSPSSQAYHKAMAFANVTSVKTPSPQAIIPFSPP